MKLDSDSVFSNALELSTRDEIEPEDVIVSDCDNLKVDTKVSPSSTSSIKQQDDSQSSKDVNDSQLIELLSSHFLISDRILLVSAGTKSKTRVVRKEMRLTSLSDIVNCDYTFYRSEALPAKDLYAGSVHADLCSAFDTLSNDFDLDHMIISPLYGLMQPSRKIVPYDCTFANKTYYIQVLMATRANIPFRLQQTILQPEYDSIVLALPKSNQVVFDLLSTQAITHKSVYKLIKTSHGYDLITLGR